MRLIDWVDRHPKVEASVALTCASFGLGALLLAMVGCVREVPSDRRADAEVADVVVLDDVTLRTVSIRGPGMLMHTCVVATRPEAVTPPAIDCNW